MKPATVGYAIYMLMGALGVIALAIYVSCVLQSGVRVAR